MKWLRLWYCILDDPKLAALDDGEFRRFINLLAMAGEQDKKGHLNGTTEDLAWRIRDDPTKLYLAIQKLIDLKILAKNHRGYVFINWGKRQFKSDRVSDRWRTWKERQESTKEKKEIKNTDTEQSETVGANTAPTLAQTFDEFWHMYPKKVGKQAAKKVWGRLKAPKEVLKKITSSLVWQASSDQWTRENGKFIPNPATYLNQGRWEDEPYGDKSPRSEVDKALAQFLTEEDGPERN